MPAVKMCEQCQIREALPRGSKSNGKYCLGCLNTYVAAQASVLLATPIVRFGKSSYLFPSNMPVRKQRSDNGE